MKQAYAVLSREIGSAQNAIRRWRQSILVSRSMTTEVAQDGTAKKSRSKVMRCDACDENAGVTAKTSCP